MHRLEDVEGDSSLLIGLGHFFLCFHSLRLGEKLSIAFGASFLYSGCYYAEIGEFQ